MAKKVKKTDVKSTKTATTTTTTTTSKQAVSLKAVKTTNNDTTLSDEFDGLVAFVAHLKTQLTVLNKKLKDVRKRSEKELKVALKAAKKKRKSGNRAPSGFVKPTRISDNLADFLHRAKGTELARTQVTREINKYIKLHNLQDPKNGRNILPDTKLRKLLGVKKGDELSYFNLQRYMSPHFFKQVKKVTA